MTRRPTAQNRRSATVWISGALAIGSCSDSGATRPPQPPGMTARDAQAPGTRDPTPETDAASGLPPVTGFDPGSGGRDGGGDPDAPPAGCIAMDSAETSLPPVALSFAFDVSGSMGKLDEPYHDPELKWEPVVAAAQAFFADPESAGISASLTFFPIDAGESERCAADSYDDPDVPVTALPSDAFSLAIEAITPTSEDDWRGGTPTLAVMEGVIESARRDARPDRRHALVLVSDGYPQGCDDNDIGDVAAAVAAVADEMKTYVIGVANPEGGPDTVSDLNVIAAAGGTGEAFIVETDDPERTKAEFLARVREIRSASVSCAFDIPPLPSGVQFDPSRANVTYRTGSGDRDLAYDSTCETEDAWRYDDEGAPTQMQLCDATCERVQADPDAQLIVEFGCARNDVVR